MSRESSVAARDAHHALHAAIELESTTPTHTVDAGTVSSRRIGGPPHVQLPPFTTRADATMPSGSDDELAESSALLMRGALSPPPRQLADSTNTNTAATPLAPSHAGPHVGRDAHDAPPTVHLHFDSSPPADHSGGHAPPAATSPVDYRHHLQPPTHTPSHMRHASPRIANRSLSNGGGGGRLQRRTSSQSRSRLSQTIAMHAAEVIHVSKGDDIEEPSKPSIMSAAALNAAANPGRLSTASSHSSRSSSSSSSNKSSRTCCCLSSSSEPNKRLSFVSVMVLLVVVQVIISCVVIWLLGYLSTLSTVSSLTATIRSSIIHDVTYEINTALALPLQAAYDIDHMVGLRFPNFENVTSIIDDSGWLAELSYSAMRYPSLSRVGFANRHGIYVLISKGIGADNVVPATFSSSTNMTVSVAAISNTSTAPGTTTLWTYRPTAIHPELVSVAPFYLQPEILQSDTSEEIDQYLGAPQTTVYNFTVQTRPFYTAAVDVATQGLEAGWSDVYASTNIQKSGQYFLAIAAVHAQTADDGTLGYASFAVTNLDNLNTLLEGLPLGDNGFGYFIRTNGHVVSSSVESTIEQIQNTVYASTTGTGTYDLDMFTSDDEWLNKLAPILLRWNLITTVAITPRNSSLVVPYRSTVYEKSVSLGGSSYHVQAVMVSNTTSGLPLVAVIVTKDSDFDSEVRANIINTVIFSIVVGVVSICLSTIVTRCISRPMMGVVDFMERSCKIIEMGRSEKQRKELGTLCEEWSSASGMVLPPLLTASNFVGVKIKDDPEANRFLCCGECCDRQKGCLACGGVGRSLREVRSMHRAFGSMLYSLASYDELEQINHAKRQFIRYIFHEVRVPFNAIVLGIEQMEMELREHIDIMPGALDTLSIISEQSQVVSRILNDVLSMQKIEDGALTLEYDVFNLEKMLRGSLYAFRSPCMDKRIRVKVDLANIDEIVGEALPALRIGQLINPDERVVQVNLPPRNAIIVTSPEASNAADPHHRRHQSSGSMGPEDLPSDGQAPTSASVSAPARSVDRPRSSSYLHRAYVRGDPYRLRQVFSNLITNAIKFSPQGGRIHVKLEVDSFNVSPFAAAANASIIANDGKYTMRPQSAPGTPIIRTPRLALSQPGSGGQPPTSTLPVDSTPPTPTPLPLPEILGTLNVKVSVRDSGPGVPAAEAAHLFQAYMQVSAGKTQKGNGTGLGLSISKSIVELHGGNIGFMSHTDPGPNVTAVSPITAIGDGQGGAEFFFTMPLDVSLIRSRTSSNGHSSLSGGSLGSLTFSSGESSDGHATTNSSALHLDASGHAHTTSVVHTQTTHNHRSVNFADDADDGIRLGVGGIVSGIVLSTMEEEEIHELSEESVLSPHVGLVHRTHTIDIGDAKEASERARSRGDALYSANRMPSPRARLAELLSAQQIGDTASLYSGRLVTPGHASHPSRSHIDSVIDIAPLAECGIGLDLDGEAAEPSVSRIRFHDDAPVPANEEDMDPTRGDWDHIEQEGVEGLQNGDTISRHGSDGRPAPLSINDHQRPISPVPGTHSRKPSETSGPAASPSIQPPSASVSQSDLLILGESDLAPTREQSQSVSSAAATTMLLQARRASPSMSPEASPMIDSVNARRVDTRPLPPKLNITTPVYGSLNGHSSSTNSASITSNSSSTKPRATHAIDLASFISEEMKAQHKAGMQLVQPGSAGWVPNNSVHLSPSAPLPSTSDGGSGGATGGGGSSPSTPFSAVPPASGVVSSASAASSAPKKVRAASKLTLFKHACRVLVVEDSMPNRKLLVSLLGRLKCVAHGVEDGQQCVDMFKLHLRTDDINTPAAVAAAAYATRIASAPADNSQYPFDIILMDGTMPVMNGVVATQILRGSGITVPIVAVTGNALAEDCEAFLQAGANHVLTKPVNFKELQAALAKFCPPDTNDKEKDKGTP